MNLPQVLTNLVKAQDQFDSIAYANCFSATALVEDEKNTYKGRTEVQQWIQKANDEYKIKMRPIEYSEKEQILKAEISGDFDGSPIVLNYHFEIIDGLIQSLQITG